ncbi:sugar ABC transporter permease [Halalkalibacterium halodurans]|jgi:multiple sugar transport system permease protein|uniref:Sugar ABC transporter permease n=1 Tax=Halalkalibacterium halodurans TaxID=86665 RepID=A0A0M0KMI3_ALKHA|nr:sugar ABC transporter permease [Halalkalibacterium halodurans]MDY7221485.1 sugar ABC transporter permease [Halalkalibacterium halodurans]MDY7240761.1 sugar ABC transporter permease [Halalkalibacterium halodurans]MED3647397.1 sugar ABC transporter permease [Halalkalibacterium halodurans]MED4080717.1 sugar ABC transporter permease [Halalkalibacterium halodurans]MED4085858.1 sugar ABC transporter permease [Halalkalibacterium halodurans]
MSIKTERLSTSSEVGVVKKKKSTLDRYENLAGWLFVAPMLIGVTVLVLLPIVATFILSMADWKFIQNIDQLQWVGFGNFKELMTDSVFLKSLLNNGIFLFTVPICMGISLVLAVVIDKSVYMKSYFKVAFFMPYISSVVAIAVVWQVLFHPSAGPINQTLMALGIADPPKWIADPSFALISVMLIQIWISVGFNLIIYIAGLQAIPKELYEAAEMDGANAWDKFRKITFPMVSPTSFFLLITGIIASFKVFDLIAVLTKGGPMHSTSVLVWHLYDTAFVNLDIGYSSAMAMILFIIVFLITIIQWIGQKKWVNY